LIYIVINNNKIKYKLLEEMQRCTKDMENALGKNDENTFGQLMDTRKRLMDAVDVISGENLRLADTLPQGNKENTKYILSGKNLGVAQGNPLETAMAEAQKRISLLMKRLVNDNSTVDRLLRTKK
ncbi:MAG: hypothetical protein RR315_07890, partial [Oscillospiraceae bacterium]